MSKRSRDNIPIREAARLPWMRNFVSVATANPANTGLTPAQMTALQNAYDAFSGAFARQRAAKAAAQAATVAKNEAMEAAEALFRQLAQVVQHHPEASNALRIEMGLNVPGTFDAPFEPQAPTSLTASLDAVGRVTLKWDRNGNRPNTTFILEWREGSSGPFNFLTAQTGTKFIDVHRAPGVTVDYRVHATRRGMKSAYSSPATIYPQGWQIPSAAA